MNDQIECPSCSKMNKNTYKFCVNCGEKLPSQSKANQNVKSDKYSSWESSKPKDNRKYEQNFINSPTEEAYCLNCGRPVEKNQKKCECGYEFKNVKCPYCNSSNDYTSNSCRTCGNALWMSHETFKNIVPKGCTNKDTLLLDIDFLKAELEKEPYQKNGRIYAKTLQSKLFEQVKIISEINARWWIVSPNTCKSCRSKIDPLKEACPTCGIAHNHNIHNRLKELKEKKSYAKTKRVDELSRLKWNYNLSESDVDDYIKSLAPMKGESQSSYRRRLFKEYGENCVILYLIKSDWNIYFGEYCMNCGFKLEPHMLSCPQCNTIKEVTALTAIFDNDCITEAFQDQYYDFCEDMELLCRDNGGDVVGRHIGVVSCPNCSNYFNYLNSEFVESHLCPHCGAHFEITAEIYDFPPQTSDESYEMWEMDGITRDEWERRMFEEMDRKNEAYVDHWREFWGD